MNLDELGQHDLRSLLKSDTPGPTPGPLTQQVQKKAQECACSTSSPEHHPWKNSKVKEEKIERYEGLLLQRLLVRELRIQATSRELFTR